VDFMRKLNALTGCLALAGGMTIAYTQGAAQTGAAQPQGTAERPAASAQAPPAVTPQSPAPATGAQPAPGAGRPGVRPAPPVDPRGTGVRGVRPAPPSALRIQEPAGALIPHPILAAEGTIVLQGTVRTQRERQEIEMMILRLPGVSNVYNLLRVSEDAVHQPVPAPGVTPPLTPGPGTPPRIGDPRVTPPGPANPPPAIEEPQTAPVAPPGRPVSPLPPGQR
jgi:hypothetical protein